MIAPVTQRQRRPGFRRVFVAGVVAASLAIAGCGGDDGSEGVTVTATEYAYDMPNSIDGGVVKMDFVNEGAVPHEFALARLDEGKTLADLDAVLKAGKEPPSWAHDVAGVPAMTSGAEISITRDLEPGTYAFVCFVPTKGGKTHYDLGMKREFTVEGDSGDDLPDTDGVITAGKDSFDVPAIAAGTRTLELRNGAPEPREFNVISLNPGKTRGDAAAWFRSGFSGSAPVQLLGAMQSIPPDSSVFLTADFEAGRTYVVSDEENGIQQEFTVPKE
jgi:uncharacterized cupredoxin-like copper-binding protein